jgi:hypothetical protein
MHITIDAQSRLQEANYPSLCDLRNTSRNLIVLHGKKKVGGILKTSLAYSGSLLGHPAAGVYHK